MRGDLVRWCDVDQCPETWCGGRHVTMEADAVERFTSVPEYMTRTHRSVAVFRDGARLLPPHGTDEVVLWDKDSTLGNTKQRHHLLPRNRPELFEMDSARGWLEYAQAGGQDEPMSAAVQLYKMLLWQRASDGYSRRYATHIVSGSDAGARPQTQSWLRKHGLWYDVLRLRTLEDRQADGDRDLVHMKVRYTLDLMEAGYNVVLWVEDWPPLAKAIERETGVPVLVLNPMYDLDVDKSPVDLVGGNGVEFKDKEQLPGV